MEEFTISTLVYKIEDADLRVMYRNVASAYDSMLGNYNKSQGNVPAILDIEAWNIKTAESCKINIYVKLATWYDSPTPDFNHIFIQLVDCVVTCQDSF